MGLDTVELVMEVEDRFDIKISDADAEQIVTVGQLHDYVCRAIRLGAPRICLTRPMFYQIRRTLMELSGVERSAVTPRAATDRFLPVADRRRFWNRLGERLGVRLPRLTLKPLAEKWLGDLVLMALLVAFMGWLSFLAFPAPLALLIWIGAAMATALIATLAIALSRPFVSIVPAGVCDSCRSVPHSGPRRRRDSAQ